MDILTGKLNALALDHDIAIHTKCQQEIYDIISRSGLHGYFFTRIQTFFGQWVACGDKVPSLKGFKRIRETSLYEMRFQHRDCNMRVLIGYAKNKKCAVLAFYEREDKKASTHAKFIPEAEKRLREMEEER